MFNNVDTIQQAMDRIQAASNDTEFQSSINAVVSLLEKRGYDSVEWEKIESLAYYQKNEYSSLYNSKNLTEAKSRVLKYIGDSILENNQYGADFSDNEKIKILCKMIGNFHEYLMALKNRIPNQKAGIPKEVYESIKIQNEYDLQHLLYAYLKPVFLDIRDEIPEDSGYGGIRVDFKISDKIVLETKCSRITMNESRLVEEIAADITLYPYENIIIYVYDKDGIIKNIHSFKKNFSNQDGNKKVYIFVAQNVEL